MTVYSHYYNCCLQLSNTYRVYGQSLQGFRGGTRSVEGGTTVDNDLTTTSSTSPHPITNTIMKAGHTDTPIDPEPLACRAITHLYHFNVTKNTQCSFQLPVSKTPPFAPLERSGGRVLTVCDGAWHSIHSYRDQMAPWTCVIGAHLLASTPIANPCTH